MRNHAVRLASMLALIGMIAAGCSSTGAGASDSSSSGSSTGSASPSSAAQPSSSPPQESSTGQGDVTLRMIVWTSSAKSLAVYHSLADAFIKTHPQVKSIKFQSVNVNNLDTILTTQLSSNDPPDLSWLPVGRSPDFVDSGALLDLKPTLLATPDYNFDDYLTNQLKPWEKDGKLYGVPFSTSAYVLYYNADLFKKAGATTPKQMIANGDWTWKNFAAAVAKVAKNDNLPGYVLDEYDFKAWQRLLPLMTAYGASPWNKADTQCTMTSPAMVQAMTLYHDMMYKDKSTPQPGVQADFWGGQAASTSSFLGGSSQLANASFKWDVVRMPSGPGGNGQLMGQAANVAYAAGKHHKLALEFLAFITNEASTTKLAAFYPPSRASVLTAKVLSGASSVLSPEQVQPFVQASKDGVIRPKTRNGGEMAKKLMAALNQYVFTKKQVDMKSAMASVCSVIQPVLSQK